MKSSFYSILLFILSLSINAQTEVSYFGNKEFINGYEKALDGESIPYFSVYAKYAKEALLTRCTDGKKIIEWETSPIPKNIQGEYAYFTWISGYSCGTSSDIRNFDMYINDMYVLTFTTYPKQYNAYMTYGGKDSTRIVIEYKVKDFANDAHGFTHLRVPLSKYTKGKALKIKVVGQNQNSNDWYMAFKYSFKEKIDIVPFPFLLKNGNRPLQFTVLHFGSPTTLYVNINGRDKDKFYVKNGFNVFEVTLPAAKEATPIHIIAKLGKTLTVIYDETLKPIISREINLVHHAHTDIGYSHIQEDVIKIHNDNIKNALKLIAKTKNYPKGSRFIWNIESSWVVENFLQIATTNEKQLFFEAVKNKQIVISATYANILTGLCTPEEMHWITEYSRKLRDNEGLPINTAMMSDIPGMSWSVVPALAQHGIRYFSNGPNYVESFPDKGDRIGHTLRAQGNKAFWWKSTTGNDSILLWTCGKGYSSWHGCIQGAVAEKGPEKIAAYMNELDSINYPYQMVQWRYNIVADNGPTDSTICDFVKTWNEKYESPILVLANVTDMFERFEKQNGKTIPTLKGDFTPYWEDGAYSTAKEEASVRLLSEKLLLLENSAKKENSNALPDLFYNAKRNILLFHEHTWGAWCSTSSPDEEFTIHQWKYKKRFADSAEYYVNKIESLISTKNVTFPKIKVNNTLAWNRNGYVEIDLPTNLKADMVMDETGNKTSIQKLSNNKLSFIANDIPANGEKTYTLIQSKNKTTIPFKTTISFNIDSTSGAIKNITTLNKNWVDQQKYKGLLQALYINGLNPDSNFPSIFKKIELIEDGPVMKKTRVTCDMKGTNEVVYEITQLCDQKYIQLSVIIDKKTIRDKEAIHIAFPFDLPESQIRIGMDESFITPEKEQIAGANKDFYFIQRWMDLSNNDEGITIVSPQAALFEIGEMVNESKNSYGTKTWLDKTKLSSTLFSYVMNNYWHTNYKADQDGKVRFDYYIHFHSAFDPIKAKQFGYEITQPLFKSN